MNRGQRRTLALLVFVLFSHSISETRALDSEEEKKIQIIDELPLTLTPLDLEKRRKYNALLTDGRAFNRFRLSLSLRMVPIRARVTPKPPFDPDFPSWFHGVSFAYKHDDQYGWSLPTALIQDADLLQFKNTDGAWTEIPLPKVCEGAELTLIQSPHLEIGLMEEDPLSKGRGLSPAEVAQIQVNTPLFAVSNLEGTYPTLDHGSIRARGIGELKDSWSTELKLSPGTPLVNSSGKVLVVRISRGTAQYDLQPQRALRCNDAPSTVVKTQSESEL